MLLRSVGLSRSCTVPVFHPISPPSPSHFPFVSFHMRGGTETGEQMKRGERVKRTDALAEYERKEKSVMQKVVKRLGGLVCAMVLLVSMLVIPEKAEAYDQFCRDYPSVSDAIRDNLPIMGYPIPASQKDVIWSCDKRNWISSKYDKIVITDVSGDRVFVKFWNEDKNKSDGNWFHSEDIVGMEELDWYICTPRLYRYWGSDVKMYRAYGYTTRYTGYIEDGDYCVKLGPFAKRLYAEEDGWYYPDNVWCYSTIYTLSAKRSLYGVNNIRHYLALRVE